MMHFHGGGGGYGRAMRMQMMCDDSLSDKKNRKSGQKLEFRRALGLLRYTKKLKVEYVLMFLFIVLQMATYQGLAYSLRYLINDLFPKGVARYLLMFAGAWVAVFAVHSIVTVLAAKFRIVIVRTLVANVRAEIVRKLQVLSLRYFDERGTGTTSAKVLMDMDRMQHFFEWATSHVLEAVLGIFVALPFLTMIDPMLTIVAFLYLPAVPVIQKLFRSMLIRRSRALRDSNEKLSAKIVDYIQGIRVIRMFATEDQHGQEIIDQVDDVKDTDIQYSMSMRLLRMCIQFFFDFTPIMIWVAAGILMQRSSALTVGAVVAYVAIVRLLLRNFNVLFNSYDQIIRATPSVHALMEIIDNNEVENINPRVSEFMISGSIHIENVDFSYATREGRQQLTDINMHIGAGEKIALVGPSGSGKTTFANVLLGLYPIKRGRISYGPYALNDVSLKQLRSQVAIMSQETFLFNTSIYENIRFANMNASREDVIEACQKAEIYDFLRTLPDGIDSHAGERGVQLSVGQRQRIGLARVFLRDPKVIILDEPSSALDVFTEQKLFATLYDNILNKTLIIIAHRLSTIRGVDRIFLFENGHIVEQGNYEELKLRSDTFAQMIDVSSGVA
jgi:ABC-type multidrug transport system fused ATPase/permease subunit